MPPKAKKRSKTRALVITTAVFGTVERSRSIHLHVCTVTPTHRSGGRVGTAGMDISARCSSDFGLEIKHRVSLFLQRWHS